MNHLNSILLEGVVVADPKEIEFSGVQSDARLVKFDLVSDRYYYDKSGETKTESLFIPVQCWGSLGEKCFEKIRKGMSCRVVGRLRQSRWEASDGTARKGFELVAEHLEYRAPKSMGKKNEESVIETESDGEKMGEPEALYKI